MAVADPATAPLTVAGKMLLADGAPHLLRGVTYGTFRPRADDARFPDPGIAATDLSAIASAGFNTIRTYTAPPDDIIEAAAAHGLRTFAGSHALDWRYRVGLSRRQQREDQRRAEREVAALARRCRGRADVAAICVGNEIPADVVRFIGADRVERSIARLVEAVKSEDPTRLVTYANYPTAAYLQLPSLDFVTFNVFLDDPATLRDYLTHLHHATLDRPLVLGEFGCHVGSEPGAEQLQAQVIEEQWEVVLERGLAGAFTFAWTDEWHVGDADIDDWSFGLTRRDRSPRPALAAAQRSNRRRLDDLRDEWPRISVVVCARNEQATIAECLTHATALDYPDYEVIVVDDGSTDATAEIARGFDGVRVVTVEHGGLGSARNVGIQLATGAIVAYLDADAYPVRDWLRYLYLAFDRNDVGGAGGPNLSPADDPPACQYVAFAPGGPSHVMLSHDRAEHIPGCNMAFWRSVLIEVGGFDPVYRAAGDDVDVCWKVAEAGWTIGFHPAAVVWHHRRGSIRRYLKQQRGYGRAEALVAARHPDRFGPLRTARWRGHIYAADRRHHPRQPIYRGQLGAAAYQSIYHRDSLAIDAVHQVGIPALTLTAIAGVPLTAMWSRAMWMSLACIAVLLAIFAHDVLRVSRPAGGSRLRAGVAVATLHVLQPLARWWGRARHWQVAQRQAVAGHPVPEIEEVAGRALIMPAHQSRADVTRALLAAVRVVGYPVTGTTGWEDHDGRIGGSLLVAGELVTSEHPPGTVQARVRRRLRWRRLVALAGLAGLALMVAPHPIQLAVLAVAAADLVVGWWRLGRRLRSRLVAASRMPAERRRGAWSRGLPTLRRALRYARRYKLLAGATLAFTALAAVVSLAQPWPLALVVDGVFDRRPPPGWVGALGVSGDAGLIGLAAVGTVVIIVLGGVIGIANEYVSNVLDRRMALDLRTEMLAHTHRLPIAFHDQSSTGEMMFLVNDQAESVGRAVLAIPEFLQGVLVLLGMFLIAFRIDPQLAMLSVVVVPFVLWSTNHYANRIEPQLHRVREMESTNLELVHQGLTMHRVIQAFGREPFENARFRAQGDATVAARIRLTVRQAVFNACVTTLTAASTAVLVGFGAYAVTSGRIAPGELTVLVAYVVAAYAPLEALSNSIPVLQDHLVSLERAFRLLDTPAPVADRPGATPIERARGDLAFRDVTFSYPTRPDTLRDVTFDVRAGETLAIVGATGAGKTTLVNLLPRFYDVDVGTITVDGRDIATITLASLRAQFSYVLQEPLLFSASIRDNIAYGSPEASDAEIEQAARDANAHEFITRLPDGYRTRLGERGTKVSGGERQRIALARAFLRDAPILILDEPTASVDSRTEAAILTALERLMEGRTTLIVAHRLSTIRRADRILVIEDGRVAEHGTHEQLIAREGSYRQLWSAQALQRRRVAVARAAIAEVQADDAGVPA